MHPGQNLFGSTRLSDESQFGRVGQGKQILYICVLVPKAERNEHQLNLRNQAQGKWTQVKICLGPQGWVIWVSLVEMAEDSKSYAYVGVHRLSESNANQIWETRLRESEPR